MEFRLVLTQMLSVAVAGVHASRSFLCNQDRPIVVALRPFFCDGRQHGIEWPRRVLLAHAIMWMDEG